MKAGPYLNGSEHLPCCQPSLCLWCDSGLLHRRHSKTLSAERGWAAAAGLGRGCVTLKGVQDISPHPPECPPAWDARRTRRNEDSQIFLVCTQRDPHTAGRDRPGAWRRRQRSPELAACRALSWGACPGRWPGTGPADTAGSAAGPQPAQCRPPDRASSRHQHLAVRPWKARENCEPAAHLVGADQPPGPLLDTRHQGAAAPMQGQAMAGHEHEQPEVQGDGLWKRMAGAKLKPGGPAPERQD